MRFLDENFTAYPVKALETHYVDSRLSVPRFNGIEQCSFKRKTHQIQIVWSFCQASMFLAMEKRWIFQRFLQPSLVHLVWRYKFSHWRTIINKFSISFSKITLSNRRRTICVFRVGFYYSFETRRTRMARAKTRNICNHNGFFRQWITVGPWAKGKRQR